MSSVKTKFLQTFPFVINNSFAVMQNMPDVDIKNPLDATNYVNGIEIIPDPAFQLKGMLLVTINDLPIFQSPSVGFFKKYNRFSIPVTARQLNRQGHVKIFAWNGFSDSSPISVNGIVTISDTDSDLSSGSDTSGITSASDSVLLFPFQTYQSGIYPQQFDLAGYKKMMLLIASQAYQSPTIISGGLCSAAVDGDINTRGCSFSGSQTYVIDYVTVAIRKPSVYFEGQGYASTFTNSKRYDLYYSVDNVNYFSAGSITQTLPPPQGTTPIKGNLITNDFTCRYIKLVVTELADVTTSFIDELCDNDIVGGVMSLSFEAKEIGSGQWIEIVSASSIGTISQGQSISKQLGDTMAQTNLNNILGSNYAGLRAKLTVVGGGIKTSVSFQRIP